MWLTGYGAWLSTSGKSEVMELSSRSRSRSNASDFASYYTSLCALHNCCPVQSVCNSVKEGVLYCQARRVRRGDWMPILTALKVNQLLHTLVFQARWEEKGKSLLKGVEISNELCVQFTVEYLHISLLIL